MLPNGKVKLGVQQGLKFLIKINPFNAFDVSVPF